MKILFVGEGWLGSSARSLREALVRCGDIDLFQVNTDDYVPMGVSLFSRIWMRIFEPIQILKIEKAVFDAALHHNPDCIIFYKGWHFSGLFLEKLNQKTKLLVNIFPDCSPHAHGDRLASAISIYGLVISTKNFHPEAWKSLYKYQNKCLFVPHGYDKELHLQKSINEKFDYDFVIAARAREEYYILIKELSERLENKNLRVAVAGNGWRAMAKGLPESWLLIDPQYGQDYIDFITSAKIVLAPVQRFLTVNGVVHPGDEDSTRTYELAAAGCFFIHRRTPYVETIYDEHTEVPMYDGAADLAEKIEFYLENDDKRRAMARAAHARAVPAYSIDQRASDILDHLKAALAERGDTLAAATGRAATLKAAGE